MSTPGLLFTWSAVLLACFASRPTAAIAVLATALYLPLGEALQVADVNLYAFRLVCLVALLRLYLRGEVASMPSSPIDKLFLIVFGYRFCVYLLNGNGNFSLAAGQFADAVVPYLAFRALLINADDVERLYRRFLWLLLPFAAMVVIESLTSVNPLRWLSAVDPTDFRGGRARSQGSFAHPTILGTFGASVLPGYVAFMMTAQRRKAGMLGIASCAAILFASNSGGPLVCAAIAALGWCLWPMRRSMLTFRRGMLVLLLLLAVFMTAPIWYLPAKLSILLGGDGWHRSFLMNVALDNLDQWWWAGMPVERTKSWFPYFVVKTGGADIINYYIDFGLAAGVLGMSLFIYLLTRLFSAVGQAMLRVRLATGAVAAHHPLELTLWSAGIVLAIHAFNWFGLVYFDQFTVVVMMQLATVVSLSTSATLTLSQPSVPWRSTSNMAARPLA